MKTPINTTLYCIGALLFSSCVWAKADPPTIKLGAIALAEQAYVAGEKDKVRPWPYIDINYGWLKVGPEGIGFRYNQDHPYQFTAIVKQRIPSFNRDHNRLLSELKRREPAYELDMEWSTFTPFGSVAFSISPDISNTHKGYELGLEYSKPVLSKAGTFIGILGAFYQSRDLVDYYYGIDNDEATDTYAEYQGKHSTVLSTSLIHIYELSKHWQTMTSVNWNYYGIAIRDSPIVESNNRWYATLGVMYEF